jgi:hypothetical protein
MDRKPPIWLLLVILIVMVVLGYLVGSFWGKSTVQTYDQQEKAQQQQQQLMNVPNVAPPVNGWCCMHVGSDCELSDSAVTCITKGGRLYDGYQNRCNKICHNAAN